MNVTDLLADLLAEQEALDQIVRVLAPADWSTPTASPRWTVTEQVAHLTYFDHAAAFAIEHPDRWDEETARLFGAVGEGEDGADALTLDPVRGLPPAERHGAWVEGRAALATAASTLGDDTRVPWYGPSMGAKSFLTARLMECWAHGQDIVDAVGADRAPTDRLRHIAQLGFITRGWTYANRGLEMPAGEVRLALEAPSGAVWTWGPDDAAASVAGPAEDFCLVVTQRRNLADVSLDVRGDIAVDWLRKAQAFAGPPTDGPAAGRSS
ncbi:MAG: TIGR03084 family metal-binding protein [Acidimicrobiales bacterium]|nr:TIGR03084 family metal-binding protein [Acidimicrobiales bacterium]